MTMDEIITDKTKSKRKHNSSKYYYANLSVKKHLVEVILMNLTEVKGIKEPMEVFGYTSSKTAQFRSIYQESCELDIQKNAQYGHKAGAAASFRKNWAKACEELRYLVKIAKIVLRTEPQKMDKLKLNSKTGRKIADILTYMELFYTQCFEDEQILLRLSGCGYNLERLTECRESYLAARTSYTHYCTATSEATEATRLRDLKVAELDRWVSEYNSFFKIATAQGLIERLRV